MSTLSGSGPLKFVVVQTREGDYHYHLTNLYDVTLREGEVIAARSEVSLSGDVAVVFASMEGAAQFVIPSEQLPEDTVADFLKAIFRAGFEARRSSCAAPE